MKQWGDHVLMIGFNFQRSKDYFNSHSLIDWQRSIQPTSQCDPIGRFLKALGDKFSYTSCLNVG